MVRIFQKPLKFSIVITDSFMALQKITFIFRKTGNAQQFPHLSIIFPNSFLWRQGCGFLKFSRLICALFIYLLLFRATPAAYGSSQARGLIGATAAGLHHNHSNMRSEPRLRSTSQLMAMLDPRPTEGECRD